MRIGQDAVLVLWNSERLSSPALVLDGATCSGGSARIGIVAIEGMIVPLGVARSR